MRLRRLALFACLPLMATALEACTSQANSQRAAAPGAKPGGTITVGITAPGSVDPSNAYEPAGDQVLSAVCEPLVTFDPLTGKPKPGIATQWIVNSGGSHFTVQLRSGVHYQHGGSVNAEDVVAEMSRVASVDDASHDADLLTYVKGYDALHGLSESNSSQALKQLSGLNVVSNDSFSMSLSTADADMVSVLGHLLSSPVPGSMARNDDASLSTAPDCTGPYEMTAPWRPGQSTITLTRFPHYYAKNTAYPLGGAGYPQTIVFKIFPDQAAEVAAFNAGELDIAQVPDTGIKPDAVGPGSQVVSAANGYVEYLGFPNSTQSPFAKAAVRAALSEALDRETLGEQAYSGTTLPATGFVPPTVGDTYRPNACATSTAPVADLTAARSKLASSGVNLSGKTLKLYYNEQFQNAQLAQAIESEWQSAFGLQVSLVPMQWSDYLQMATSVAGFDGAFLESWQAPYPSADGYLYPLFDSNSIGQDNFAHLQSSPFDQDLQYVARQADDPTGRSYDYQQAERYLCQYLTMVPLVFRQWQYLVRTNKVGSAVGSFTDRATGLLDLREIYVK